MTEDPYRRLVAKHVSRRTIERLGQGVGILGLVSLPLLATAVSYVLAVRADPNALVYPTFADAVISGLVAALVWIALVAIWSLIRAPSELHEATKVRLTGERDAEQTRADAAEEELRSVIDDLTGSLTLRDLGADVGHLHGEPTFAASIGITMMNSAEVPIRYETRRLEVTIAGVTSSNAFDNVSGYLPPFGGTATHFIPYVTGIPWSFPTEGSIAFVIAYGVRNRPPSHEYRGGARFTLAVPVGKTADEGVLTNQWRWQGEPEYVTLADPPGESPRQSE